MKGLMIKDLKLMKNQKSFAVIFAAVILFYLFTEVTATIIIGYACIVSAMFTVGTLSYDDLDNGNAFLFTLPFARKSYAAEKYILTILTNIIVWTVSTALAIVFDLHRVPDLVLSEYIFTALLIAALTFLLNAVMIPTQMKFGGNRGIIAMMAIFLIGSAVIYSQRLRYRRKKHAERAAVPFAVCLQRRMPDIFSPVSADFLQDQRQNHRKQRILDEKILRNLRMSRTTLRTFLHPLSVSVKINI